MDSFPFKPGDWAADIGERIAVVKDVYECDSGEFLLDLVMYDYAGTQLGRTSPAMGGPKKFEPACPAEDWRRIARPSFPMVPQWVTGGDGRTTMRYWAGETLPPADWAPRARKPRAIAIPEKSELDLFREALEKIAAGHNDARGLAAEVLERKSTK